MAPRAGMVNKKPGAAGRAAGLAGFELSDRHLNRAVGRAG